MELSFEQKLLLHSVLFHYLTLKSTQRQQDLYDGVSDLLEIVTRNFDSHSTRENDTLPSSDSEEEYEEDSEDDDQDADAYPADVLVDKDYFLNLPVLRVLDSYDNTHKSLAFFSDDDVLGFTLGQDEFIDVVWMSRTGKTLTIKTVDEEFVFEVSKFSKEWTSAVRVDEVVGVQQ